MAAGAVPSHRDLLQTEKNSLNLTAKFEKLEHQSIELSISY